MLEFDSPRVLLTNPNSHLASLVEQTGPAEAEYLRTLVKSVAATEIKQMVAELDHENSPASCETDPLLL